MAKVNSKLVPPSRNPCLSCKKIREFMEKNNVRDYRGYCGLPVKVINELRTAWASCKGAMWAGKGSGSYKSDLVAWWLLDTMNDLPVGAGKTSRFSAEDISRMRLLHEQGGMTWQKVADCYGIDRASVYRLVNGCVKKLRAKKVK